MFISSCFSKNAAVFRLHRGWCRLHGSPCLLTTTTNSFSLHKPHVIVLIEQMTLSAIYNTCVPHAGSTGFQAGSSSHVSYPLYLIYPSILPDKALRKESAVCGKLCGYIYIHLVVFQFYHLTFRLPAFLLTQNIHEGEPRDLPSHHRLTILCPDTSVLSEYCKIQISSE